MPPGAWSAMSARDAAMADNVRWVLSREGPGGRVLVFAHNQHVKNAPTEGGVWISLERDYFTFFSSIFRPSEMKKTRRGIWPSKTNSIWRSVPSS